MSRATDTGAAASRRLTVRKVGFDHGPEMPRHWFADDPFRTHMLNGLHVLFPDVEAFVVRTIRAHLSARVSDELRAEMRAFNGQEAQHAAQHRKFLLRLEELGYDLSGIVRRQRSFIFDLLERRLGARAKLSVVAGFEHLAGFIGEFTLGSTFLDGCEPSVRDLLEWHAAEEIEHRCLAYDVLQQVDDDYLLRVIGMAVAFAMVYGCTNATLAALLRQDRLLWRARTWSSFVNFLFCGETRFFWGSLRELFDYVQPGFHPSQKTIDHLAERVLRVYTAESQP